MTAFALLGLGSESILSKTFSTGRSREAAKEGLGSWEGDPVALQAQFS